MTEKNSIPVSINPDFQSPKPFMTVNEAAAFRAWVVTSFVKAARPDLSLTS